ncbi:MAG: hypothetical protein H0U55_16920 [Rubrobacteraceae bacterium]|nr:hypothetical protein [Rubrobacteraceae bacterium]
MRKTTQTNEMADDRSAGVATHEATPGMGSGVSFVGSLLRLARLRSRKVIAEKDPGDTTSLRGRPDPASDAARASMEAGLTRGASLLFGNRR